MSTDVAKSQLVRARVDPALVERFALAARLQGHTVSSALRLCMAAFVAGVAAQPHNDDDLGTVHPEAAETPEEEAPLAAPV